jgi:TonB family protein
MRGSVILSSIVHVGAAAALFASRSEHTILVPGPDVVQVSLIESPAPEAPAPPAAMRAQESVAPVEPKGVRIEKPKREKHPQPEPAKAPEKEPPAPVTPAPTAPSRVVLPYASVGQGMRGQVAVDDQNFEFAYYLQQVRALIARNWTPPGGIPAGMRAEVYFRVSRDGSLTQPRLESGSGNEYFDQSATRAVVLTGHLPPLPLGYVGADLGIHFGFEYTGQ